MTNDKGLDQANDILDSIQDGAPSWFDDADSPLVNTFRALNDLHDAFALRPAARERIWNEIMNATSQMPSVSTGVAPELTLVPRGFQWTPGQLDPVRIGRQRHRWWPAAEIAAAILIALGLVAGFAAFDRVNAPAPRIGAPAAFAPNAPALYVSAGDDEAGPQQFQPLDPLTLADLKGQPDITFAADEWNAAVSGDGRTIVTVSYAATNSKGEPLTAGPDGLNASGEDVTLVVRDGLSGAERLQFHPPVPVLFPHLSEDGSRLVMMVHPDYGHKLSEPRGAAEWYVFDTKTGKVLASVTGDALYSSGIQHFWIDAGAARLYYLPILGSMDETKPPLLQLYAYDLTTGSQIGHVDLPGIVAGSWSTKETASGSAILRNYQPGAALSPDGRQLAIVHADAETVTLIDVEHLKVDRTIALTRPSSVLDTVLGMLPLAPHDAAAKSEEGTQLTAVFGVDGQHLYVFGAHGTVDDGGRTEYNGLGLQLIDLRSGTIEAQKLDHTWIYQVLPARDGQNIYVISANGPQALSGANGPETVVRRLDASSLASRGVRSFDGYRLFLLRPAPNPGI